jgi:hypothetical protein
VRHDDVELPAARVVADHDPEYEWARQQRRRTARGAIIGGIVLFLVGGTAWWLIPTTDKMPHSVILKDLDGSPRVEVRLPDAPRATGIFGSVGLMAAGVGAVVTLAGIVNLLRANRVPRLPPD